MFDEVGELLLRGVRFGFESGEIGAFDLELPHRGDVSVREPTLERGQEQRAARDRMQSAHGFDHAFHEQGMIGPR